MKKLKLYDYFRSSACYRVRIALNLKNLSYDLIPIHLLNEGGEHFFEDYKKINPQSLVPTLQDDDHYLTQSIAIIEYLEETHPTPALLPKDPYQRALVRAFALAIAADIHPLNNLRVLTYLQKNLNITDEQKKQWYSHWVELGLAALEQKLVNQNSNTTFCFTDYPSFADICLIPQIFNARRFQCDMTNYPTLIKIEENCLKLPAFNNAAPIETNVKG